MKQLSVALQSSVRLAEKMMISAYPETIPYASLVGVFRGF